MSVKDIELYSVGIIYASACAPADVEPEKVEGRANELHPTGVTPWKIAAEDFKTGEPNPTPCDSIKGRTHWLLTC